jgi:cytochrome P450 family 6
LYEIAKNPQIQERIREEIRAMLVRTEGKVTYEAVMNTSEMPYLNQIIYETLRIYAIISMLDRVCVNPKGYSLKGFGDYVIPQGMPIFIPIYALQQDEKYFPDPTKFDPDRFAPENAHNIKPYTNFPFGAGPRNCVGERFGLMQAKTGIVKILKDFRLEMSENTPKEIVLEKKAMLVQSDRGLYLNLIKDPLY